MKKILKVIGTIFLVLLLIIVLALLACFFYQRSSQKKDRALLMKDGFVNLISAGSFDMNMNIYGDGKYKVIAMPGSGDAAFTVDMKMLSEHLSDDISLIVTPRPGYGLCTDTDEELTTELVVEGTRTALKNAGIEPPYILMPHSMGGLYGTYWESNYPDEVSGVIFLDTINSVNEDMSLPAWSYTVGKIAGKMGVMRFLRRNEDYSEYGEYAKDAAAFNNVNILSPSVMDELKNFIANSHTAFDSVKTNDIPKIYVSTNFTKKEDIKDYLIFRDGEYSEEAAEEIWNDSQSDFEKEQLQKRSEYFEKVGNCKEINLPGSHFMYAQHPEKLSDIINDFVTAK